ncbi:MAG: hypothetical protein JO288_04295, partial [Hyphomicrobiales bacterium]|nr:hypothetical protein [Hyphomicrobiales bacterium]
NYVDNAFYQASSIGNYWIDMAVNGSHYTGCHHMLLEGNWGNNCDNDNTHGNEVYQTFFRNWCTGLRTDFIDPSFSTPTSSTYNPAQQQVSDARRLGYSGYSHAMQAPGQLHPAGSMALDYWMSFVGNVLGESGVTTTANGWTYQYNGQHNMTIWILGWVGGGNNDPNLTGNAGSYLWRHGNYDYLHGSIFDWQATGCGSGGACSQTLPDSFYLSSAPAFFSAGASCLYLWPWVTPTGSSQIQTNNCGGSSLPAKARYDAGTPLVQP